MKIIKHTITSNTDRNLEMYPVVLGNEVVLLDIPANSKITLYSTGDTASDSSLLARDIPLTSIDNGIDT